MRNIGKNFTHTTVFKCGLVPTADTVNGRQPEGHRQMSIPLVPRQTGRTHRRLFCAVINRLHGEGTALQDFLFRLGREGEVQEQDMRTGPRSDLFARHLTTRGDGVELNGALTLTLYSRVGDKGRNPSVNRISTIDEGVLGRGGSGSSRSSSSSGSSSSGSSSSRGHVVIVSDISGKGARTTFKSILVHFFKSPAYINFYASCSSICKFPLEYLFYSLNRLSCHSVIRIIL